MKTSTEGFVGQDRERSTKYFGIYKLDKFIKTEIVFLDVPIITPSGLNLTSGKYINFFRELSDRTRKKLSGMEVKG